MPANLTPQYRKAEQRLKECRSESERLEALQEMLRTIPKHKGTEKMQAQIKRRIALIRKESGLGASSSGSGDGHHVERQGAGQVVVCGPPNSGKSQLVASLTKAHPEIGDYPFTTREPLAAMMPFEDIQIQLVDTVGLARQRNKPWQLSLIENADSVVLLFDVTDHDLLDQTDFVVAALTERGIGLGSDSHPPVSVFGNKVDRAGGRDEFEVWRDLYRERFDARSLSALNEADLLHMKQRLFHSLSVVRVYTKPPGVRPSRDSPPLILSQGSTILEAAAAIHLRMRDSFKSARVWSRSGMEGSRVDRTYSVQDGDIVEIQA